MANYPTISITSAIDASIAYGTVANYQRLPITTGQYPEYPQYVRILARSTGQLGAAFTVRAILVDPTLDSSSADFVRLVVTLTVTDSALTGGRAGNAGAAGSYLCVVNVNATGKDYLDLVGGGKGGYEWRVGSQDTMNTATAVELEFVPITQI